MTDRELILKQILKKGNGSCKKLVKIYRSRGEFYAPKAVNRSFEPASGLQIRTLHLKILQDTYRHIAKAVLYCMEN